MAKLRYTKEITEICKICGYEGKTEIHHIISQAKIERIKPHEHGAELDLTNNHGNLIELCVPCHDLTSHSWYRAKMIAEGKSNTTTKNRRNRRRRNNYIKAENNGKPCLGYCKDGRPCKNKGLISNGYCKTHQNQFKENKNIQKPVGLHDEGRLEEFEIDEIMLWRELGIEPDIQMFKDKSDEWKKRWLT
jgi:hypothetical protein